MQEIMQLKSERKARLEQHPFYGWMASDGVRLEERLSFAPIMANFVMNFRDMNKWFLRFTQPSNRYEQIINGNTLEDETHSRLFLEDWKKLGLDDKLGWRASDTIWWLFLADDTEAFRGYGMEFAKMSVVDGGDPLVRFAHSEAGEACGNAFFSAVSQVASKLQEKTGIEYRYFGVHHLKREPGHVLESPGVFENQLLNPQQRVAASALANKMFDIFFGMHDRFLGYAEGYVGRGAVPRRPAEESKKDGGAPAPRRLTDEEKLRIDGVVKWRLDERKARTAAHPFFAWMREKDSLSPKQRLQRFIPMWINDIMGYRDLNHYALRYVAPAAAPEHAINAWVDALESHSVLFLNDWDALAMDSVLGWRASDTLKFCFLDPDVDVHRRNISRFIKLAFAHPKPLLRYWLLEALESSGDAFFENTRALAARVEQMEPQVRLDYLGDRHDTSQAPRGGAKTESPLVELTGEPMRSEEREIAAGMVDVVFDAVDEQLSISLEVARSNKFGVA